MRKTERDTGRKKPRKKTNAGEGSQRIINGG